MEDFINDQVVELDKMEAALKQTVANKQKVDEELTNVLQHNLILEANYHEHCSIAEVCMINLQNVAIAN